MTRSKPSWVSLGLLLGWSACGATDGQNGAPAGANGGQQPAPTNAGTSSSAAGSTAAGTGTVASAGTSGTVMPGAGTTGSAGQTPMAGASGSGQAGAAGSAPIGGSSEWRMMGYDAGSTYFNSAETVLTKQNAATLAVAWRADMGNNVYGAPLQIGDTIYASAGGVVQAFKADSGDMLWRNTRVGTTGSMAYEAGTLYLNTISANIVALDATGGEQKWSKPANTAERADGSSSPILAGDLVLVGGSAGGSEVSGFSSFRGYLAALDKTSGDLVWTSYTVPANATGASLWSSVAVDVAANRVFGGTGNNHTSPATDSSDAIVAFDFAKGDIVWKNQRTMDDTWSAADSTKPDADFGANPVLYEAIVNGVMTPIVAAGQKSGGAHGVRRTDGMLVWTRSLCPGGLRDGRDGIFVNGAWSGKYMLFACNGGGKSTLFGLDGATGNIAWQTPLMNGEVYGRISAANGVGFVGSGTELVVFDTDTGSILKTIPSQGGTVAGTITIANGRVAYGEGLSWSNGRPGSTLTVLKVQ